LRGEEVPAVLVVCCENLPVPDENAIELPGPRGRNLGILDGALDRYLWRRSKTAPAPKHVGLRPTFTTDRTAPWFVTLFLRAAYPKRGLTSRRGEVATFRNEAWMPGRRALGNKRLDRRGQTFDNSAALALVPGAACPPERAAG
jgi:hypothetical protein